jgi:hypothetical protein
VAGDESWRSVFRDDRLELINLFLDPEGILRLAVNNLMFEFLERADDADALARLTRFVWLRAVTSHSRFRFRILQIAPENRSLFVSQWLQEFQA